jgi:hypothetical protein
MGHVQRYLLILLAVSLVALGTAPTAFAQEDDGIMSRLDFSVKAMQGAQFFRTDLDGVTSQAEFGFQRVRYNFQIDADIHEKIRLFADLGHEPNDFGNGGGSFSPAIDLLMLDLMLNDEFLVRLGTPVTTPFNFRGYSDGAETQSNPVIGNTPIDFITAQTGVALVGNLEGGFGFDVTITSPTFYETFQPGTGVSIIGKAKYATETFGVGGAVMKVTSQRRSGVVTSWIRGDGENYSLPVITDEISGPATRLTHAYLNPGISPLVLHADAMFKSDIIEGDIWGGISTEQNSFSLEGSFVPNPRLGNGAAIVEEDSQMLFLGATAKINLTDNFFLGARASYADNSSDWASDLDNTTLFRIQGGFGLTFLEKAMFKIEYVNQSEGVNSPGQIGDDWYALSTELSVTL